MPHIFFQMALRFEVIYLLKISELPVHENKEASPIIAFERFEVVDTAIIQII